MGALPATGAVGLSDATAWPVERRRGRAGDLHRSGPEGEGRRVVVLDVERPALVLGSTQPGAVADDAALAAAGVDLARRRSGGGAVLLEPDRSLWVDVWLPRHDRLWDDDVGRSADWLGRAWAAALGDLGLAAEAHAGGMARSRWSSLVCFAGLAPGEVTDAGRKVVGVSQRRTRAGARFQCGLHRRWDPRPLLDLLALDDGDRAAAAAELASVAVGVDVPPDHVVDALVRRLPTG